jgi:hypothetical protein
MQLDHRLRTIGNARDIQSVDSESGTAYGAIFLRYRNAEEQLGQPPVSFVELTDPLIWNFSVLRLLVATQKEENNLLTFWRPMMNSGQVLGDPVAGLRIGNNHRFTVRERQVRGTLPTELTESRSAQYRSPEYGRRNPLLRAASA